MSFISVIIPVFNREKQFVKAVESVLFQTYRDFELLIVDDGSVNDIKSLLPNDERIHYFRTKHKGVSHARNYGIKNSGGEWIAFLDSDDVWDKNKLSSQMKYISENDDCKIMQCQEIWIRRGRRVNPAKKHHKLCGDFFVSSLDLCLVSPSAVIINKEVFSSVGYFDEKLPACEDYDLWLRILLKYSIGLLDDHLVTRYAGHDDQLSFAYDSMDRFRVYSLLKLLKIRLESPYRHAVKSVLRKKSKILADGSLKRKNLFRWGYYFYFYLKSFL